MDRTTKLAALGTVLLLAVIALALVAVLALQGSRSALREARATTRNLCLAFDGVTRRDIATIEGNPREAAAFLRLLGITEPRIAAYLKAQYAKGGPVDRAVTVRRKSLLDCSHEAKPVRPAK
jgi:hypothetical protein